MWRFLFYGGARSTKLSFWERLFLWRRLCVYTRHHAIDPTRPSGGTKSSFRPTPSGFCFFGLPNMTLIVFVLERGFPREPKLKLTYFWGARISREQNLNLTFLFGTRAFRGPQLRLTYFLGGANFQGANFEDFSFVFGTRTFKQPDLKSFCFFGTRIFKGLEKVGNAIAKCTSKYEDYVFNHVANIIPLPSSGRTPQRLHTRAATTQSAAAHPHPWACQVTLRCRRHEFFCCTRKLDSA